MIKIKYDFTESASHHKEYISTVLDLGKYDAILTSDFHLQMFLIILIWTVYSVLVAEGLHLLYVAYLCELTGAVMAVT